MRIRFVSLLLLPSMLFAQRTSNPVPVPVEEEPLHKVMFKNDFVTVIHVTLPPGQTTLYHSHTHDRVAIDLSAATITQQKINEPEGPSTAPNPANISPLLLEPLFYPPRVRKAGKPLYKFLDINPPHPPATPSPDVA